MVRQRRSILLVPPQRPLPPKKAVQILSWFVVGNCYHLIGIMGLTAAVTPGAELYDTVIVAVVGEAVIPLEARLLIRGVVVAGDGTDVR